MALRMAPQLQKNEQLLRRITRGETPNQKCIYGTALAISGNHWLYLVIFGMPLEQYYF